MKTDALIFHRTLPHYRAEILGKLAEVMSFRWIHCSDQIDGLSSSSANSHLAEKTNSLTVRYFRNKGWTGENIIFMDVVTPILKYKPRFVFIQFELSMVSIWLLFLIRKLYGIRIVLWGHGYDRKEIFDPRRSSKDKLRLYMMRQADAVLFYNANRKKDILSVLPSEEIAGKMFVANNTLNTDVLFQQYLSLQRDDFDVIKRKIGFTAKYNLIYIGRIVQDKEPLFLIEVMRRLLISGLDVHLHVIGRGSLQSNMQALIDQYEMKPFVKMYGEILDNKELGPFLYASDAFVMPGFLGLSIVHAFCFRCPVISKKTMPLGPFHSTEIEYLENGETGLLLDHDIDRFTEGVYKFLVEDKERERMKKKIDEKIASACRIQVMQAGFQEAIRFLNMQYEMSGD